MMAKLATLRNIAAAGLAVAMMISIPTGVALSEDAPQGDPQETPQETPKKTIELKVSDVKYEDVGRYGQFTYAREFHDHGGAGAKIRHGQVCYSSGGCISAPLEYIVEADGVLVQEGQLLMPMAISQAFEFTYIGEDGNGDKIIVKARILVVGDQLELQELE